MSKQCKKCDGQGLIGNGPKPWLKQGHVTTCDWCKGTGKIDDDAKQYDEPQSDEVHIGAAGQVGDDVSELSTDKPTGNSFLNGILRIFK